MSELTVTIFSHKYRLAVSTGEEELLERCAKIVDDQMNAVRAGGKVISADQIAVLSALEIAYEAEKRRSESAGRGEAPEPSAPEASNPSVSTSTEEFSAEISELCAMCEKALMQEVKIGSLF